MLGGAELRKILLSLPNHPWNGVLYRAASLSALGSFDQDPPTYPENRILYGYGAPKTGARYTQLNGPPSLYLAEEDSTAIAEATLSGEPQDPKRYPPKVICSINVSLETILDITTEHVQAQLGTSSVELTSSWRMRQKRGESVPTQTLGQAAFDCGRFQGIRYPSARVAGKNCFVVFIDKIQSPSYIEIYDPERQIKERIPTKK